MKMRFLVGVLVFLIVVNLATIGTFLYVRFFQHRPPGLPGDFPGGPGFEGRPGGPPPFMMLDEPQRKKMKELMESLREETSGLNDRAAALERRTFDLLQEDPAPTDSIDQMLTQISSIRLEISR